MRIFTKLEYHWNGDRYIFDRSESFEYKGLVDKLCGATKQQNQIAQQEQGLATQLTTQSQAVFGASSSVFNSLQSTFAPIIAAGPSQQGFSQQQLANLNSEAITQTGQEYKNEKEAVGNAQA